MTPDRRLWAHAVIGALASAGYWTVWIGSGSPIALYIALVVQPSIAVLVVMAISVQRRSLALALAATVPVLGPIAAVLSSTTIGTTNGSDLLHDPNARPVALDGAELARRLRSLPVCEALVSGDAEARSLALAKLTTRAAAEDVTTLRWARSASNSDASVDIAMAFEEVCARFDRESSVARTAATAAPSFNTHSEVFAVLHAGIVVGVVDSHLVSRVADEAARHCAAAVKFDATRGKELLAARVHLALLAHRPDEALALLEAAGIDVRGNAELTALFRDAAYATRRFDLIPEMKFGTV